MAKRNLQKLLNDFPTYKLKPGWKDGVLKDLKEGENKDTVISLIVLHQISASNAIPLYLQVVPIVLTSFRLLVAMDKQGSFCALSIYHVSVQAIKLNDVVTFSNANVTTETFTELVYFIIFSHF